MITHESSSFEFASTEQLRQLWDSAQTWLEANGGFFVEPKAKIYGQIDSVPVTNHPPNLHYICSADALRAIVPKIFDRFEITDHLDISLFLPWYDAESNQEEPPYMPSGLLFSVERDATAPVKTENIHLIPGEEEGDIECSRDVDYKLGSAFFDSGLTYQEKEQDLLDAVTLEEEMGMNRVTGTECSDLQDVVNNLDAIKAFQDRLATE